MQSLVIEAQIHTNCPSCQSESHFQHIGSQKWPEAVAIKLNLPSIIEIYRCENCKTTLTDLQLNEVVQKYGS